MTHPGEKRPGDTLEILQNAEVFWRQIEKQKPLDIFGLPASAQPMEIRSKYHELITQYHPDKHALNPELAGVMTLITRRLLNAYQEALIDAVGTGEVPAEFRSFWAEFAEIKMSAESDAEKDHKTSQEIKNAGEQALRTEWQRSQNRLHGLGDQRSEGLELNYERLVDRFIALTLYLDKETGAGKTIRGSGLERTFSAGGETELKIKEENMSEVVKRIQSEKGPFTRWFASKGLLMAVKRVGRENVVFIFTRGDDGKYVLKKDTVLNLPEGAWPTYRLVNVITTPQGDIPVLQERLGGKKATGGVPDSQLLLPNGELSGAVSILPDKSSVFDTATNKKIDTAALARQFLPVADPNKISDELDSKVKELPDWKKL